MGGDAPLSDIAEENKKSFTTVVRPIPQFDPSDPKMISQGPSVCVFNKEDPGEVLRSFFILLKNMEFCIEPFIDKDCLCPGWKINGEIIVNPGQEE